MSLSHKTHLYFLNNKKKKLSNALLFMTTIKKSLNSSKILTIYNPTTIITNNNKHSFHFNIYQTKTTQSNPNQTTINHHFENNSKNNTDNSKNNNNNTDNSNHNNSDTINNNNNNTKNNKTILIIFFLLFSGILTYHYFTSLKIEKKLKQFISIQTESDYLNLLNELNEDLKEKLIKLNVKIVNSKKNNLQFHSEIKNLLENEKDILTLTNDVIFYYFIVQQIVKSNKKTENKNILQYVIVKKDLEFEFKEAKDYNNIDDKYIDYNKDYNEDYNSEDYSQLTNEEKKLNLIKNLKIEPFNDISSNLTDLLNKTLQENTMTLFTKSTVTKLSNYTTNKLLEFIKESKQPLFIEINNNNSTNNNNVSDNNEYEIKEIKRKLDFTTDIHTTLYTSNNNFNNYNNNMNLYSSDKNNNLNKEIISSIEYRIIQGRILKDDPIYCYGKIKRNVDNNTTANVNFNDDDNNTIYSNSNDNNDSGESDNIVDNNNSYNSKNNNSYGNISGEEERKEFSFIPLIVMSGKDDSNLKQTLKLERTSSEVMFLIGSAIFLYAFFK
ncbi:hypothetical protein ABK040_007274 [Willaertia magna]